MNMNNYTFLNGSKEDYIYFLLKHKEKQIFPIYFYDDSQDIKLIYCYHCYKLNKITPIDSYERCGEHFYCLYCDEYVSDESYSWKDNKKLYVFTHKYICIDKNNKIKKYKGIINDFFNVKKYDNYCYSNKKYKCKINFVNNLINVNNEMLKMNE